MARINVEDELFADYRFKRLAKRLGDPDRALGILIRFWAMAQKHWGNECALVPIEDFEMEDFQPILEVGLAERRESGIYAKGSEERFGWYLSICRNSRKGVTARKDRSPPPGEPIGQPIGQPGVLSRSTDDDPSVNRAVNPLAPAPAPAPVPAPALKKEEMHTNAHAHAGQGDSPPLEHGPSPGPEPAPVDNSPPERDNSASRRSREPHVLTPEAIDRCCEIWIGTLRKFKTGRVNLLEREKLLIVQAMSRFGPIAVELALEGARYEPKDERFDPSKFVMLHRYLAEPGIERFINLGAQERHRRANGGAA